MFLKESQAKGASGQIHYKMWNLQLFLLILTKAVT